MKLRLTKSARAVLTSALRLFLLSALWAVASLLNDLLPHLRADSLASAQRKTALFSVFAVVAAFIAVVQREEFPRGRRGWANACIGVGLFVVPFSLVAYTRGWMSDSDRVIVFSLTPVFAVILEPHLQGSAPRQGKGALAGALAAVACILFIFPLDIPNSFRAGAALCALVAATLGIAITNCFAVKLARSVATRSTFAMAAQAGAASAICFAMVAAFTPDAPWNWGTPPAQLLEPLFIDLPTLFLIYWLMRRLGASRMAARFLLAPLFTIVAGFPLESTYPPVRAWLGLALLAGGAGWLVFAPAEEPDGKRIVSLNVHAADVARQPQIRT